jgi:hypothetical protein
MQIIYCSVIKLVHFFDIPNKDITIFIINPKRRFSINLSIQTFLNIYLFLQSFAY